MTKAAPEFVDTGIDLSAEEMERLTARAKPLGIDVQTYIRVRCLTANELPEPAAFFALSRRLAAFTKDYEACLKAFATHQPDTLDRVPALGDEFGELLQAWEDLYGPRPEDEEPLPEPAKLIVELPPVDAAEERQLALQEANMAAYFSKVKLPPGTDHAAVRRLLENHNELVHEHNAFMVETSRTGVTDRARLRQLLEACRQARRQFLLAVGADPESEDLLPFIVNLYDT